MIEWLKGEEALERCRKRREDVLKGLAGLPLCRNNEGPLHRAGSTKTRTYPCHSVHSRFLSAHLEVHDSKDMEFVIDHAEIEDQKIQNPIVVKIVTSHLKVEESQDLFM